MVPVASSPSEAFCHLQGVVTLLEESTSQSPWWPDLEGEWSKWPPNMGWWTKAMPCLDQLSAPYSKVKIGQSEVYRIKWEKILQWIKNLLARLFSAPNFHHPPHPINDLLTSHSRMISKLFSHGCPYSFLWMAFWLFCNERHSNCSLTNVTGASPPDGDLQFPIPLAIHEMSV